MPRSEAVKASKHRWRAESQQEEIGAAGKGVSEIAADGRAVWMETQPMPPSVRYAARVAALTKMVSTASLQGDSSYMRVQTEAVARELFVSGGVRSEPGK